MQRIIATVIKEWHMVRRDPGGLALLFLMPLSLIMIMALVQDAPFRDYKNLRFKAICIAKDKGKVAEQLIKAFRESKQFDITEDIASERETRERIKQGEYQFAIIIPNGISAEVVNSGNLIANEMGRQMGMNANLPHRASRDQIRVQLMFDPVSKPAFRLAIQNAVEKFLGSIQSGIILQRIRALSQQQSSDSSRLDIQEQLNKVGVEEIGSDQAQGILNKSNSVQHNVPAWAIFGMFFMTIIICENMISERSGGNWTRLRLIPGSSHDILVGKFAFYAILGILQFYLMLLAGIYLMPLVELPALQTGHAPGLLFAIVVCLSCCATSFGMLIGSLFQTTNQALPVAAISVVILSAIGGVWVPVEILPKSLKLLSTISPMRWGLEAINNVLLRDAGWKQNIAGMAILLSGAALTILFAWMLEKRRTA